MSVGRLLIVDDETALAQLLKQYLERLGYRADVCSASPAALELVKTQPTAYSVLVADLAMPEINGEELIDRARVLNPQLNAILTSGYAHRSRQAGVVFLQKPFTPKALAEEIARMAGPAK